MWMCGRSATRRRALSSLMATFVAAVGASGVVAAGASAQAIRVLQACVVNAGDAAGTMTVVGAGFAAGDSVDLESSPAGAFMTANLAVATNPATAKPSKKETYSFSGFRPGAEIYAHYLHRNKVTATSRFGRTDGACGLLNRKARFYPGRQRFSKFKVQLDDSRTYSPRSLPRYVTTPQLFRV